MELSLKHGLAVVAVTRALSYTYLDRTLEAQQDTARAIDWGFNRFILELVIENARRQR